MRTVERWVSLVAVILFTATCGSDPMTPVDDGDLTAEALVGSWTWSFSEGGITGERRTPETEGFDQTLVISDSNGIALFRDGEPVASTSFEFVPTGADEEERSAELRLGSPLFGFDTVFVRIDEGGNLVLEDPCCDGFIRSFAPTGSG